MLPNINGPYAIIKFQIMHVCTAQAGTWARGHAKNFQNFTKKGKGSSLRALRALQRAKSGTGSWLRGWLVSLADFIVCTTRARRNELVLTLVCSLLFSVSLSVLRNVYSWFSELKSAMISEILEVF